MSVHQAIIRRQAIARESLAIFLRYIASDTSCWFVINGIHSHHSSLSNRCGMSEISYNALLVAANLATYNNGRLAIKPKEWGTFINDVISKDIDDCKEVATPIEVIPRTRLDLTALINGTQRQEKNVTSVYCIRIGTKYGGSPKNLQQQLAQKITPLNSIIYDRCNELLVAYPNVLLQMLLLRMKNYLMPLGRR